MSAPSTRYRRVLAFAVLSVACLALGVRPLVLEVGQSGPRIWVREGDLVSLQYTQSMYGVPVEERFRVEEGRLALYEVVSADAALEYLGIETRGADNARRVLQEFSISAGSVGGYVLSAGGRRIDLAGIPAKDGRIRVRLTRQALLVYLVKFLPAYLPIH